MVDFDGDTDTATLTITVDDVIEPAGAFLVTNTNAGLQDLRLIVTSNDPNVEEVGGTPTTAGGQAGAVPLGGGVVFEETESYAVIVKFISGSGTTNLTDLDLIFDLGAEPLDAESNIFLTLLGEGDGNVQLGEQGSGVDGVIWQIDGTGNGFTFSPAILYDIQSDPVLGDIVVLNTDQPNTSFVLDFGLLPTGGNVLLAENSLFGGIEVIDITGSQTSEVNELTLTAQDVIDVTDPDDMLVVLGNNDVLVLADEGDLRFEASGLTGRTLEGSSETFDIYNVVLDGVGVVGTVFVDDDLTVQF